MRELLPKRQDTLSQRDPTRARVCEGITKRSQVSIACRGCRSRKIRCDNRKPKCTPCLSSNQECHFPISRFVRGMNIEDLPYIGQRHQCLLMVFEVLRDAEGSELEELMRQIRTAESVDTFLDSVHEATLLLPLKPRPNPRASRNGQKKDEETGSKQGENDDDGQSKD